MNIVINDDNWTKVDLSGDKQITNQGTVQVRIKQSTIAPTNAQDGMLLSTYKEAYASIIITGADDVWVLPMGGQGLINVQVI